MIFLKKKSFSYVNNHTMRADDKLNSCLVVAKQESKMSKQHKFKCISKSQVNSFSLSIRVCSL